MNEIVIVDERKKVKAMHRLGVAWPKQNYGVPGTEDILTEHKLASFVLIDIINGECDLCADMDITNSDCGNFTTLKFYVKPYVTSLNIKYSEWVFERSYYEEKLMSKVVETLDRIAESTGTAPCKAKAEREFKRLQNYLKSKNY